jgi:hypothetical protein
LRGRFAEAEAELRERTQWLSGRVDQTSRGDA